MMRKLQDYIISEFFTIYNPIFFGLLVLSMAIRFAKLYEAGGFNLPFKEIVIIILLVIPSATVVILPLSFLIAISVTTTKLSHTTELVALQASGISAIKVFKIYLSIAVFMMVFYLAITVLIKPTTNHLLKKTITGVGKQTLNLSPIEKDFSKITDKFYIFCDKVDNAMVKKVILFQLDEEDNFMLLFSERGILPNKGATLFTFNNGELLKIEGEKGTFMRFRELLYNPLSQSLPSQLLLDKGTLSTLQLYKKIKEGTANASEKVELTNRLCAPFSLFFFLLLSYPFSLGFSRNYKTSGIVISIVVGLTYLIFNSLITTFSMKGFIEPIKSITLSYVVLLAISLVIFYKKTWNRI